MTGFIDLQVNGWGGVDFSAPGLTLEAVGRVADELRPPGTAAFCPTVVTCPLEVMETNLALLAQACAEAGLADRLAGIHLEGPFISPQDGARGAHPRAHVRPRRWSCSSG